LVVPHIDYACLVYADASQYLNTKLQRLSNCAVRFVFSLKRDASITVYRTKLNWMSVTMRRTYFLGLLGYKIFMMNKPSYLRELFVELGTDVRRSARLQAIQFHVPHCRTNFRQKSFMMSVIKVWRILPNNVKLTLSYDQFKAKLANFLVINNIENICVYYGRKSFFRLPH
ncbi:hypothetical protein DD595_25125, partial [Enterobacter cloacae complex sp. 4DZ3-17B2]